MNTCLFVSDLHGKMSRYEALFKIIKKEKPDFVFIGGDLLPRQSVSQSTPQAEGITFINNFLLQKFNKLREIMDCAFPDIFFIPGNSDQKIVTDLLIEGEKSDLWRNLHNRSVVIGKYHIYGYAFVPPTPFKLKDWEKFDVSEELGAACISPHNGFRSSPSDSDSGSNTIKGDLELLTKEDTLEFGVFLFHSPPFQTYLDLANINTGNPGQQMETVHLGSKAIRAFIDEKQPYITMHGHIHESVRLSGEWKQPFGKTWSFSAAHDGPELSVIKFDLHVPMWATRRLIKT